MKKSLFALAAVGAFAGAAQAQSSVTVYGVIDTGLVGGNQRLSTSSVTKATWMQVQASGAESTNRIGFRGTEDLGGGKTANFVIELGVNANNDSWSPVFRQMWGGLADKSLGAIRFGTQNTLIWQLAAPMTVGQLNNLAGSVINPNNFGTPADPSAAANGNSGVGFTNRTQRTVQVDTNRMAGFQAKAMYMLNNSNTTQTTSTGLSNVGGVNNFNGWGVSLDYTGIAKLRVAAAYQSLQGDNPFTTTSTTATSSYTVGTPTVCGGNGAAFNAVATGTGCVNVRDNQAYVAAMYDFGILTAYANYVNRKVTSQQNASVYVTRTAQEIGVRGYVTKTIEGWASVGNGRYTAFGLSNPTANITGFQVGSNYWMSKRTNLYAIYGQAGTSSTTAGSSNVNNYAVGVRHTF